MIEELKFLQRYNVDSAVINSIEEKIAVNGKTALTGLQEQFVTSERDKIFEYEFPEKKNKHIIIQGTTSSGKTLTAELLTLKYLADYKKVVYLVPLKALVTEKCRTFRDHFNVKSDEFSERKYKIYASSSDYQDHDKDLLEGSYDIAVVVYEKFFAMLTENPDNKFLEDCSLIVVDELQSISMPDRGPKLEFALTRVMHGKKTKNIRIMGLTTIDCKVDFIRKWMDSDNNGDNVVLVQNYTRPISIEETIIGAKDGKFRTRFIDSDGSKECINAPCEMKGYQEGTFKYFDDVVQQDFESIRTVNAKEKFLMMLLSDIFNENKDSKVIVFVNSRVRCSFIANQIAEAGIIQPQAICHEALEGELSRFDDDERRSELHHLYTRGVAYHSAQLRMSLREAIERAFKDINSNIKILVATETITVGMNMPADVMIVLDETVTRSGGQNRDISLQEYRNYIGRAGRLGVTKQNKGRSYLITRDYDTLCRKWKQYIYAPVEYLVSALNDDESKDELVKRSASYYLNLLPMRESFSLNDMENWTKRTLSYQNQEQLSAKELLDVLKKRKLVAEEEFYDDEEEEFCTAYKVIGLGQAMAPFALSIKTCKKIADYFVNDGLAKSQRGGLPYSYKAEDLKIHYSSNIVDETKNLVTVPAGLYILDILAIVCDTDEVKQFPNLKVSDTSGKHEVQRKAIIEFFDNYEKCTQENAYWKNSVLKKDLIDIRSFSDAVNDQTALDKVYRAMLLSCWMEGLTEKEIRKQLKLTDVPIYESDLGRLADICSYILEAISKCLTITSKRMEICMQENPDSLKKMSQAFYRLSSRVKYGLNDSSLLRIAKWQIPGVERYDLIKLARQSKKDGFDNVNIFLASGYEGLSSTLNRGQISAINRKIGRETDRLNIQDFVEKYGGDYLLDDWKNAATRLRNKKSDRLFRDLQTIFEEFQRGVRRIKEEAGIKYFTIKDSDEEIAVIPYCNDLVEKLDMFVTRCVEKYSKILVVMNTKENIEFRNDVTFIEGNLLIGIIAAIISRVGCLEDETVANWAIKLLFRYFSDTNGYIVNKGEKSLEEAVTKITDAIKRKNNEQSLYREKDLKYYMDYYAPRKIYEGNNSIYLIKDKNIDIERILKVINISNSKIKGNKQDIDGSVESLLSYLNDTDGDIRRILEEWFLENSNNKFINQDNVGPLVEKVLQYEDFDIERIAKAAVYLNLSFKKLQEASVANKMGPRFVKVHEYSYYFTDSAEVEVQVLLVMDKMDYSLDKKDSISYLQENKEVIIHLGLQICEALNDLHSKKLLHRDIKPSNLFAKEKEYYLGDLGSVLDDDENGTADYRAPEMGTDSGTSSDIYSLGLTLCELYKGSYFPARRLAKKTNDDDSLIRILAKSVQENPEDRYQSVEEFKKALELLN